MNGGTGDDTYYFSPGSGIKRLQDDGGNDRLVLQGGINLNSIKLSLGSLMIGTGTAGDELHLDGVDYNNLAATSPIDVIEFSNGQTMTVSEVIAAVGIDIPATPGADILTGTSGRDNINALAGDDTVNSGDGDDVIKAGEGKDIVHAGAGNDMVNGDAGEDILYGEDGNDQLSGGSDNDTIYGGAGNDLLDGGSGTDTLAGGLGDDTYTVDSADDVLIENPSEGQDTVIAGLNFTLAANFENLRLAEGSATTGTGNELDNRIEGNSQDNILNGLAGADTLIGGAGNDQYLVDNTGDSVVEAAGGGTDTVTASVSYTLADNVENLVLLGAQAVNGTGNSQANILTGNELDNLLDGGAGDDRMAGGRGDDTYVVDSTGDVVVELAGEGADTVESSINWTLAANIENLTLSGTADTNATGNNECNQLIGNSGNNILDGQGGDDEPLGGAGDDRLIGGAGEDRMLGGTGDDTYVVDNTGDVIIELAGEGNDTVESSFDIVLGATLTGTANINAVGNAADNNLIGNSGNNILDGGLGTDILEGGAGNDTYLTESEGDTIY